MIVFNDLIRRTAGLALVAIVTAACGSTVPSTEQQAAEEAAEEGLGLTGGNLGDTSGGAGFGGGDLSGGGTTGGGAAIGGSGSGAVAGGGSSGSAIGGGGTSGGSAGSPAHGVTATEITLGLPVIEDVSAGNRALTGGNVASGIDFHRAWEAIVEDTNKRGGIAGHKVKPVYYRWSATSEKTEDQEAQEACAYWTQDHEVFAGLYGFETENWPACMERAGAAVVSGSSIRVFYDERIFPKYPHFLVPFGADLNTQATSLVDGLAKQNYFGKGMKLGLLTFDDPGYVYATKESLIPALRRHGLKLTDWVRLKRPASYGDYGQFSGEAGNAALKFKSEGITHVMILDVGANIAFFFMQQAEKQQYRPRYGLTSQSGGTALADLLAEDARNQLKGARAIGWAPTIDEREQDDPPSDWPATKRRCIALMRKAGVEMSSRNAEGIASTLCDQMWFTKAAVEAGGRTITLDSLLEGTARLGSGGYSPGITFLTALAGNRHDGLGAVAHMSFVADCRCFKYTSKPYKIPN